MPSSLQTRRSRVQSISSEWLYGADNLDGSKRCRKPVELTRFRAAPGLDLPRNSLKRRDDAQQQDDAPGGARPAALCRSLTHLPWRPRSTTLAPAARRAVQLADLAKVPVRAWSQLAACAIEPNAFYQPAWARAVSAHARGRGGAKALLVWDGPEQKTLIGMLPVVSAWRALKLPVPVLVAWQAYAPLTTPLLDRDAAEQAAGGLLDAARLAGAGAILFPNLAQDGPAAAAIARRPRPPRHPRACP